MISRIPDRSFLSPGDMPRLVATCVEEEKVSRLSRYFVGKYDGKVKTIDLVKVKEFFNDTNGDLRIDIGPGPYRRLDEEFTGGFIRALEEFKKELKGEKMEDRFTGYLGETEYTLSFDRVDHFYIKHDQLQVQLTDSAGLFHFSATEKDRFAKEFNDYCIKHNKGKIQMTNKLKQYIDTHADTFFTLAFIIMIDHFVLQGALRQKIQDFCEKVLHTERKKLDVKTD